MYEAATANKRSNISSYRQLVAVTGAAAFGTSYRWMLLMQQRGSFHCPSS